MGGMLFFQLLGPAVFIIYSLSAYILFSRLIISERVQGELDLVLLTGVGKFSYLVSQYTAAWFSFLSLLIVQIPLGMYAISFGGIHPNQVISIYLYLIVWLFLISQLCLFCGVIFSRLSESYGVAFFLILLVCLALEKLGIGGISRIDQFLAVGVIDVVYCNEMNYFLAAGVVLFVFSVVTFIKLDTCSVSFLPRFLERVRVAGLLSSSGRMGGLGGKKITVRFNSRPLFIKDLYLFPPVTVFLDNFILGRFPKIFFFCILVGFYLGGVLFWGITVLFVMGALLHFNRFLNCFFSELDCHTLPFLVLLPMTPGELLEEKILASQSYMTFLKYIYVLALFFLSFALVLSIFDGLLVQVYLAVLALPLVHKVLIQLGVFLCFKMERPKKTSCGLGMAVAFFLYLSYPLVTIPLFAYAFFYLKKRNIELLQLRAGMI
jgi:hypothetical protein